MFSYFGKILIFSGFLLVLIGTIFLFGSKIPYLGKLPGDIYVKRGSFTFFAPIGTCLVISIIISLIFYLISKFFK
ncbi:MAG: DUF2905 domain-containing protein [Patescibacteria group bacterium]|nr:DUF2905 domain-containing protein [Patescibacteria group bacterium]